MPSLPWFQQPNSCAVPDNNPSDFLNSCLATAENAALLAGQTLRQAFGGELAVDEKKAYDIKLALDRETQLFLEGHILAAFPDHVILGEEGSTGDQGAPWQWVIDPIDGTVNFFYGIPHFCISIALRHEGRTVLGLIHDPMLGETWTVIEGGPALLNGRAIHVSDRDTLAEAIVTVGFSKSKASLDHGFERYRRIAYEVRKTRLMGSAALAMAYIASGRLDAYIEEQISLWDIAAGHLLVEAAGGTVILRGASDPEAADGKMFICASNGKVPLRDYV
ncbi:MAG: inositol monophosphatase family protein [Verrucomicrobiales bacterium]